MPPVMMGGGAPFYGQPMQMMPNYDNIDPSQIESLLMQVISIYGADIINPQQQ
jgi:hypothetical protein